MKIMKIIPLYTMLVISMLTLFVATTFGYAYFDNLSKVENVSIQTGEWHILYHTGFESYTTGNNNVNLDGKIWNLTSVASSNVASYTNGNKSLQMIKNSNIVSTSGFRDAQSISFWFGKSTGLNIGEKTYEILLSVNGGAFKSFKSGNAPKDFTYLETDISSIYTSGLGGVVASKNSIINFKIIYNGKGFFSFLDQNLNIDDIKIIHRT